MTSQIGTPENPVRVAIVGAGPSGFYAAEHILKDEDTHAQVDLFDRLPTPFGLVRGGVAPDHPKIKSVIRVYEKTAAREGFRFFGNVKVGHDIEVEDLERLYHAIVYTVGCETDRQLGIPGEDLPGSHAATAFVGWYNAHPDYCDEEFDLSCERAVVIGNGNVAMDVARMLALTDHELRQTDTADHAIERARREARSARSSSSAAAGRRRPPSPTRRSRSSARWRTPTSSSTPPRSSSTRPARPTSPPRRPTRRPGSTSRRCASSPQRKPEGKRQRIVLRFLASPVEIKGDGRVEKIVIGRNELVEEGGTLRAKDTRRARGARVRAGAALGRLHRRPDRGRSLRREARPDPQRGRPRARLARLRPQGRPLHRRLDQARPLGRDRHQQERRAGDRPAPARRRRRPDPARPRRAPSRSAVEELLAERGVRFVSFEDWQAIDQAEVGRGEPHGRPRVKFVRVEEMLGALGEKVG